LGFLNSGWVKIPTERMGAELCGGESKNSRATAQIENRRAGFWMIQQELGEIAQAELSGGVLA